MCYCCEKCFANSYIIDFIKCQAETGVCDYCNAEDVFIIDIETLGYFFRECFDKAYESLEMGTGAYFDPEEKEYCGPEGVPAIKYSIMDILEEEGIFDDVSNTQLIEDIMAASGPSLKDLQHGEIDPYGDIYDDCLVLQDDLINLYGTKAYYSWDHFKFAVKHYNRFFDVDALLGGVDSRKQLLDAIQPLIMEYATVVPEGTVFYRVREMDASMDFDTLIINKELSPAPPKYAQTNRMSPAGISYLYLASSKVTACKECRYVNTDTIVAEYHSKKELQIIDFSLEPTIAASSIFSDEYDHDTNWMNRFLRFFSKEISYPVDNTKVDHAYEYAATQLIAEYIRGLGFDGIGFKSSVGQGKSYCFFCGPDLHYCKGDYGIFDDREAYDMLPSFLDAFRIEEIALYHISKSGELQTSGRVRINEEDVWLGESDWV